MFVRKFMHRSYRYLFILFVFSLPLLRNVSLSSSFDNNAYAYFIYNFGGLYPTESIDMMSLIFTAVPNVLLIYMFSDIMREDCLINYIYVFSRMGKKQKWLFQNTLQLFLQVFTVYVLLYAFSFIVAGIAGLAFGSFNFYILKMILITFFLNVSSIFLFVFMQNFLSLRFGGTQAFLFVMLLYLVSLIVALLLYNYSIISNIFLAFLIPSNQMYIWHTDCAVIHGSEELLKNTLEGFRTVYSFLILVSYIFVEYQTARHIFLKNDLLDMIKPANKKSRGEL